MLCIDAVDGRQSLPEMSLEFELAKTVFVGEDHCLADEYLSRVPVLFGEPLKDVRDIAVSRRFSDIASDKNLELIAPQRGLSTDAGELGVDNKASQLLCDFIGFHVHRILIVHLPTPIIQVGCERS